MTRLVFLSVLACVFQVITAQGPPRGPRGPPGFENIPEKCRGPPPGVQNPEQCCQVEPMYTDDELAGCGFTKITEDEDIQSRRGPPDCSKPFCLLQQKGFVEGEKIKYSAVAEYLEQWAGDGSFKDPVRIAKEVCLQEGRLPGPPHICEPVRLMHCIGGVIFGKCPEDKWLDTDSCKALKEHMEECKPPFQ